MGTNDEDDEHGNWDVVGADNGRRSVHLLCRDCSPASAAEMAGERVLRKYGQEADLKWWTFSARPAAAGPGLPAQLWFYIREDGRAVPVGS